jgi:hypothetical protein
LKFQGRRFKLDELDGPGGESLNKTDRRDDSARLTPNFDPSAPGAWPVHIDKQLGVSPIGMVFIPGYLLLFQVAPKLASGLSIVEVLTHTITGVLFLGLTLFFGAIVLFTRKRGRLTIDASGIDVWAGKDHAFYAWSDIMGLDVVRAGVQVSLKGRSNEQNLYNIVSSRFAKDLRRLLNDAREHFAANASQSGRSIAPGDDLRAARMKAARLIAAIMIPLPVAIVGGFAVWQVSTMMKDADLQKHGRRAEATVVKIFTADCGRHSCSLDARFSYTPAGASQALTGIERIASDDEPGDPDLAYAKAHGTVPIVYDVRNPKIVELNFRDSVFQDHSKFSSMMFGLLALMALIIAGPFLGIVGWLYVRALRTPPATSAQGSLVTR